MSRKVSKMEKQSGVIPYRVRDGRVEVLPIPTRTSNKWVIPKAGIPNMITSPISAVKED